MSMSLAKRITLMMVASTLICCMDAWHLPLHLVDRQQKIQEIKRGSLRAANWFPLEEIDDYPEYPHYFEALRSEREGNLNKV